MKGRFDAWAPFDLAVLWSFAVAQPLFDLLGRNPEFFVARESPSSDIVLFAIALVLVPPLVAALVLLAIGFVSPVARWWAQVVLVGALAGLFALTAAPKGLSPAVAVAITIAVGAGAAYLYARAAPARQVLRVLAPVPLLFLALFLFFSETSKLVFPDDVEAASQVERISSTGAKTPVVMLVFDQLNTNSLRRPDGSIDAERFPNFARLARRASYFPNAAGSAPFTTQAVPALLTGRTTRTKLPIASDQPDNLFTLLSSTHREYVTEPVTSLCPETICGDDSRDDGFSERMRSLVSDLSVVSAHLTLPRSMREGLPAVTGTWGDFREAGATSATAEARVLQRAFTASSLPRVARVERFLAGVPRAGGAKPPFVFAHMVIPHFPFEYYPSLRRYKMQSGGFPGLLEPEGVWDKDPALPAQTQLQHLLQAQATDTLLGKIVRRLDERGLFDDSLVVVTADHGLSYRPGRKTRELSKANVEDTVAVPLLVKEPGQNRGRTNDEVTQATDIVPTIADVLGMPPPWKMEGRAVLGANPGHEQVRVVHGESEPVVVSADFFKDGVEASLRRNAGLFYGPGGMFGPGPSSELMGKRVADLPKGRLFRREMALDRARQWESYDPASGVLPLPLEGYVKGMDATDSPEDIALAVNGRIESVSRSYQKGDRIRFHVMVREEALRPGANRVELFATSPPERESKFVLRPDGLTLESPGRAATKLEPGGTAVLDSASSPDMPRQRFAGWAADAGKGPYERIAVFVDGRYYRPRRVRRYERPDVMQALGSEKVARSGFEFYVPEELMGADKRGEIRVFAIFGRQAAEVRYPAGYAWTAGSP